MVSDIIHAGFNNGSISGYCCNATCGYHPHKISWDWKDVTCKNCLNIIKKFNRFENSDNEILLVEKI